MDKLDRNIIFSLNTNGRKSFRHIAKELKVPLLTISDRVKRLEKEGIIEKYIPVINKEKIGYDLTAVINIKLTHGNLLRYKRKYQKIITLVLYMILPEIGAH